MDEKRLITETVQEPIARDLPGDPCWVWRWLDIGGGGEVMPMPPGTPLGQRWKVYEKAMLDAMLRGTGVLRVDHVPVDDMFEEDRT